MSLKELNQALAENKEKVGELIEKAQSGGGGLPDWDDDSPIIASGQAYSSLNIHWEITQKGTFRWVIDEPSTAGKDNQGLFSGGTAMSTIMSVCPQIVPFLTKIRQAYVPNGIVELEIHNMVNCERVRFPDNLTKKPTIATLPRVKELDMSADIWATLSDYQCNAFYSLEKVQLCPKTTKLSRDSFSKCYSLKEINLENITNFAPACLDNDFSLTGAIVFNASLTAISATAFRCTSLTSVTFRNSTDNLPTIANNSFQHCNGLLDIYVPWAEGAVANAPWGATNATIHYNAEV